MLNMKENVKSGLLKRMVTLIENEENTVLIDIYIDFCTKLKKF